MMLTFHIVNQEEGHIWPLTGSLDGGIHHLDVLEDEHGGLFLVEHEIGDRGLPPP